MISKWRLSSMIALALFAVVCLWNGAAGDSNDSKILWNYYYGQPHLEPAQWRLLGWLSALVTAILGWVWRDTLPRLGK